VVVVVASERTYPPPITGLRQILAVCRMLARYYHVRLVQPGDKCGKNIENSIEIITFKRAADRHPMLTEKKWLKALACFLDPAPLISVLHASRRASLLMAYCITFFPQCLLVAKLMRKPLVLLLGDVFSIIYWRARALGYMTMPRLFLYALLALEKLAVLMADKVVVVSYADGEVVGSWGARDKLIVIPLSLDEEDLRKKLSRTCREKAYERLKGLKALGNKIVMFHGNMKYPPNRLAALFIAEEVAPRVWASEPHVVFALVGPHPPDELARDDARVAVPGPVGNIYKYIELADVGIAPIFFGSGVKNKVLEYMALSKPVVATRIAVEGLRVKDGVHFLLASGADEFAKYVVELLRNKKLASEIGENARNYVMAYHSLKNYEAYKEVIEELLGDDREACG